MLSWAILEPVTGMSRHEPLPRVLAGAPWRDPPERCGKWPSVYHRFNRWRKDGTFDRVLKALRIRLE